MADTENSVDTEEGKLVRKWIGALDECDKWQRSYLERCRRIVRRYRNERPSAAQDAANGDDRRYAVLWSNIQTLAPAVYARTPSPVVTRRYKDSDPVGRYASEVLERSLTYSMDQYEFDDHLKLARDDFLLLARGQIWTRFIPHETVSETGMEATPEAEIQEDGPSVTQSAENPDTVPYAEVVCEHVAFDDWGLEPCRSWDETSYVWRRVYMDRAALVERFGKKIGGKVPLDWAPERDTTTDNERQETRKRAAVYEIWNKTDKEVIWISRSYVEGPLDRKPDWLKLRQFFPCPRPLIGTLAPDSYLPVPDYVYYQDQAEEIDELTARIGVLVDALKLIGVYAGEEDAHLQNLFQNKSGTLVPIANMAAWSDKGGFKGVIEWVPLEQVASTLQECINTRKEILNDIYQITGMSDIIRGMSDPRETATAQAMKGQWGSLRVRDKQKELARFARDILRIQGEIIAGLFPVSTLKVMTDVKLLDTVAQKQMIQRAAQPPPQAPQMPGQPPMQAPAPPPIPPQITQMLSRPTWEEVGGLLKDSAQRGFRVDVETDSTIEPNEQEEKAARVEFVTAMGQLIAASLPLLQSAPQAAPLVSETVKFLARGFRVGREMEDVIEQTFDQLQQNPPKELGQKAADGPQAGQVAGLEMQTEQIKQQGAIQVQTLKNQNEQAQIPLKQADQQLQAGDQQLRLVALQRDPNPQAVSNG